MQVRSVWLWDLLCSSKYCNVGHCLSDTKIKTWHQKLKKRFHWWGVLVEYTFHWIDNSLEKSCSLWVNKTLFLFYIFSIFKYFHEYSSKSDANRSKCIPPNHIRLIPILCQLSNVRHEYSSKFKAYTYLKTLYDTLLQPYSNLT